MVLSHHPSSVVRLRVTQDEPDTKPRAIKGRRHGARQPFADETVQRVRHLVETTTLTHQTMPTGLA